MRPWKHKIDDLNEGRSVVELDLGYTLVKGVYLGLLRVSVNKRIKWYFEINEGRGEEIALVDVKEITKLKVLHRGK